MRQGSVANGFSNGQPIVVNVDDLASFRAFLGRELSQNLAPAASHIIREHGYGVGFGTCSISGQVQFTRQCYGDALRASTNNMAHYVQLAHALIDGIREVMVNYQGGDLTAEELIAAVNSRMINGPAAREPGGPT